MKKFIFCAVCCSVIFCLSAAEVTLSKAKVSQMVSKKIPVDASKEYIFTANVKGGTGRLTFIFFQFNGEQRRLGAAHVWGNADSVTELVAPALRGTTEFFVKDASKWKNPAVRYGTNIVAFKAKNDCSDLPNFRIDYYIKSVTKMEDGTWKIEMKNPLRLSNPKGTLVRQHYDGGHLSAATALPLKNAFSRKIGAAKGLGPYSNALWPGVKFVQIFAQVSGDVPVTITEWSLKEVNSGK